jgi:hypothetical protein
MTAEHIPSKLRPPQVEGPKTPRAIKYGIGIQVNSTSMGMTHGPVDSVDGLLEEVPEPNSFIIRFNADWTETFLWKWAGDRWISIDAP